MDNEVQVRQNKQINNHEQIQQTFDNTKNDIAIT